MALKDTNPSEEYPYVFMIEQSIFQTMIPNMASSPKYTLSLSWKYYKVLEDGTIVFSPAQPTTYVDDDFYSTAILGMVNGVSTDVNTLGAQQLSVKQIVENETGKSLEVI